MIIGALDRRWSLADQQLWLHAIFGPRLGCEDLCLISSFLFEKYGFMLKCIRKDQSKLSLNVGYAIATNMVLCNRLGIDLGRAMARKFPGTCIYCGRVVCTPECAQTPHGDIRPREAPEHLLGKGLDFWQATLRATFHTSNQAQGLDEVSRHLGEEIGYEIMQLVLDLVERRRPRVPDSEILEGLSLECADALAWTIAVANFFDLDVADLFVRLFQNGCPSCMRVPCIGLNAYCLAYYAGGPFCPI